MVLVESTNRPTVQIPHQGKWIRFREHRGCSEGVVWIFTDGSSKGGFGAVLVVPGQHAHGYAGYEAPTPTNNVGAELNGLLLGLKHAPVGSRVAVVSDYLGVAAWMTGNWKIKDSEVSGKIAEARALICDRNLSLVGYVHHGGHQRDDSEFTRWNNLADRLCDGRAQPGPVMLDVSTGADHDLPQRERRVPDR